MTFMHAQARLPAGSDAGARLRHEGPCVSDLLRVALDCGITPTELQALIANRSKGGADALPPNQSGGPLSMQGHEPSC